MLRWNPTRTAWKAPALALALLAGPAAVPALAGAAHGVLPERPRHDRPGAPVADRALRHRAVLGARQPAPAAGDVGGAAAGDGRPHHHAADDHVATGAQADRAGRAQPPGAGHRLPADRLGPV